MRIQGAKSVHYDSGPNMTPLVDVVMVILIFLMLAGSFTGAEHYLVSNLPAMPTGPGDGRAMALNVPVEIYVDSIGGRFSANASGLPRVSDSDALVQQLVQTKLRLGNGKLAAADVDDVTQVLINPGSNVKYQDLLNVYQAALEAKFSKVGFTQGH